MQAAVLRSAARLSPHGAPPHLANMRRSSGFWAAGTLRMAARSCSDRLASRLSVILLFSGESPLGSSSALELSMLGLVRVMSSLLAENRHQSGSVGPCPAVTHTHLGAAPNPRVIQPLPLTGPWASWGQH